MYSIRVRMTLANYNGEDNDPQYTTLHEAQYGFKFTNSRKANYRLLEILKSILDCWGAYIIAGKPIENLDDKVGPADAWRSQMEAQRIIADEHEEHSLRQSNV